MTRILVVSHSDLSRDPRVRRQIAALRDSFVVDTLGLRASGMETGRHVDWRSRLSLRPIDRLCRLLRLVFRQYRREYNLSYRTPEAEEMLLHGDYSLIIANDIEALPISVQLRGQAKVLWDAHEYSPRQSEHSRRWRLLKRPYIEYLCRSHIRELDAAMTVSSGIAKEYQRRFGKRFDVIENATPYRPGILPSEVNPNSIRLVHHGVAIRSRCLERMVTAVSMLPARYSLDLYLVPTDETYYRYIHDLCERTERVKLLPPVDHERIVDTLNTYDVGILFFPPATFNLRFMLPNKLYEYVQARLVVVAGPTPEVQSFVEKHGVGLISADFTATALSNRLLGLSTGEIQQFKARSHRVAETVSSASVMVRFRALVARLLYGSSTISSLPQA